MSPQPDDDLAHGIPDFGRLGESSIDFERRRLREQMDGRTTPLTPEELVRRDRLNRELKEREESIDDRHDVIAEMAAGRAPALARAYNRGDLPSGPARHANALPPAEESGAYRFDEDLQQVVPAHRPPARPAAAPSTEVALDRQEVQHLIAFEMREAFGTLQRFLGGIQHDIQAQTRLMSFMDAPMEAITGAHERAAESFETLRRDIANEFGAGSLKELAKVIDTAGLADAQSRAEARFERLAEGIELRLKSIEKVQAETFKGLAADMLKVLHLLDRLQSRELREMQRRAAT